MKVTGLTASQKKTLATLRRRGPATTYTSNLHGASFVPYRSAESLEALGLAKIHIQPPSLYYTVTLTPAGLKVARDLDP